MANTSNETNEHIQVKFYQNPQTHSISAVTYSKQGCSRSMQLTTPSTSKETHHFAVAERADSEVPAA